MQIYQPREDSQLLERHAKQLANGIVLDMGTGTGIQARAALEKADFVIGIDVNQQAVDFCRKKNDSKKLLFLRSDLFSFFERNGYSIRFDTILFNAPYLPNEGEVDAALDGGKDGHELIEKFLKKAGSFIKKDGTILLIFSSLSDRQKIESAIEDNGFVSEELERIHISFEDIYCYRLSRF